MPSPPVRPTTLQEFLKERTGMRVAEEAVTLLVELLTATVGKIATEAAQAAVEDERSTIMARDIQAAYDVFLRDSGLLLHSTAKLHTAIDGISNAGFKELFNLLRADIAASS